MCISEQLSLQYSRQLLSNAFFKCHKRVNKSGILYRNYIYSDFILKSSATLVRPIKSLCNHQLILKSSFILSRVLK